MCRIAPRVHGFVNILVPLIYMQLTARPCLSSRPCTGLPSYISRFLCEPSLSSKRNKAHSPEDNSYKGKVNIAHEAIKPRWNSLLLLRSGKARRRIRDGLLDLAPRCHGNAWPPRREACLLQMFFPSMDRFEAVLCPYLCYRLHSDPMCR